jgi:hypothetical protein
LRREADRWGGNGERRIYTESGTDGRIHGAGQRSKVRKSSNVRNNMEKWQWQCVKGIKAVLATQGIKIQRDIGNAGRDTFTDIFTVLQLYTTFISFVFLKSTSYYCCIFTFLYWFYYYHYQLSQQKPKKFHMFLLLLTLHPFVFTGFVLNSVFASLTMGDLGARVMVRLRWAGCKLHQWAVKRFDCKREDAHIDIFRIFHGNNILFASHSGIHWFSLRHCSGFIKRVST